MRPLVPPRVGAMAGLAGFGGWIVLYTLSAVAMASGPGYDITRNYLSDLGNPHSPLPWAFNAADMVAGLLALPFGLALAGALGGRAGKVLAVLFIPSGVALFLIGVFPEESPYNLHGLFSIVFFVLLTVVQGVMVLPARRNPQFWPLAFAVTAVSFVLNAGLVVTTVVGVGNDHLAEHLGVYSALAWELTSAVHLWRVPAPSGAPSPAPG